VLVISDGLEARIGAIRADRERFMPWRTIEGETLDPATMPQLEVLLRGVFDKRRFLDLIRHFIVFDDDARRDWSLGGQQAITITGANRSLIGYCSG
jgi:type I restriction enzyme R subunit